GVDAEIALIEHGRAVGELVGNEGDESRNVTIEVQRRAFVGGGRLRLLARSGRGLAGGHVLGSLASHGQVIAWQSLKTWSWTSQDQNQGGPNECDHLHHAGGRTFPRDGSVCSASRHRSVRDRIF